MNLRQAGTPPTSVSTLPLPVFLKQTTVIGNIGEYLEHCPTETPMDSDDEVPELDIDVATAATGKVPSANAS